MRVSRILRSALVVLFLLALTSPPVHSATLGLADNTSYSIFLDVGGNGTDFVGTLTTGVVS